MKLREFFALLCWLFLIFWITICLISYKGNPYGIRKNIQVGDTIWANSKQYAILFNKGWSQAEPSFRWTDRTPSTILFNLLTSNENPQLLTLSIADVAGNGKRLKLTLNAKELGNFDVSNERVIKVAIPGNTVFLNKANCLKLEVDSPASLAYIGERRLLGLALNYFILQ